MDMVSLLYGLLVQPIEYLIEVIFWLMYGILDNVPMAIISVSILVSFLVLPLYLRADSIQEDERKKQKQMDVWVKHIRNNFSGDERYMLQTAYYREMRYRPLYALRSVLPLMLQIPFFLAAYHYLSHMEILNASSLGPIMSLGEPDSLLKIGKISVHVLPVLMTVINCISGLVYTEKGETKQRIQIFGTALVFLVLLYESPSGLVLYWTMNNILSLLKNVVQKHVKKPGRLLSVLACVFAVVIPVWLVLSGHGAGIVKGRDYETMLLYLMVIAALCVPMLKGLGVFVPLLRMSPKEDVDVKTWLLIASAFAVLMGLYIPVSVVYSSPGDFVNLYHYISPLYYVGRTFCVSIGVFLVWGGVIWVVASKKARNYYIYLLFVMLAGCLLDYMCFRPYVGNLSKELILGLEPDYSRPVRVVNMLLLIGVLAIGWLIWLKSKKALQMMAAVLLLSLSAVSVYHFISVGNSLREIRAEAEGENEDIYIRLSTEEENVVVLMLDRMMAVYLPFIMQERPELEAQFDGFVYYPNTVATGLCTNYGSPGLYGGYDYTTSAINARSNLSLMEKHNEALSIMPRLFNENGYRVSVWDPPYANYRIPSDLSYFDQYPGVNALHMEGRLQVPFGQEKYKKQVERNFFFYSVFKVMPTLWQDEVYDGGSYMSVEQVADNQTFLDAYAVLDSLPDLTVAEDDPEGFFLIADNNTTHEPREVQLPDYTVTEAVDNSPYADRYDDKMCNGRILHFSSEGDGLAQYHADVVAMMALGRWFDDLRAKGVYDNTRIILVSDHGVPRGQFEDMMINGVDTMSCNAFLMVKDFNATGFKTDDTFMTNCDTPALALEGIVENPTNPYTGNEINMDGKNDGVDIMWGSEGVIFNNNGNVFLPLEADWFHVSGDIYQEDSWYGPFEKNADGTEK